MQSEHTQKRQFHLCAGDTRQAHPNRGAQKNLGRVQMPANRGTKKDATKPHDSHRGQSRYAACTTLAKDSSGWNSESPREERVSGSQSSRAPSSLPRHKHAYRKTLWHIIRVGPGRTGSGDRLTGQVLCRPPARLSKFISFLYSLACLRPCVIFKKPMKKGKGWKWNEEGKITEESSSG